MDNQALLRFAEAQGIVVAYRSLYPEIGFLGMYFCTREDGQAYIVLDEQLRWHSALHKVVLAEEIGHHMTTPMSDIYAVHLYHAMLDVSRDEHRAMRWACEALVPTDELFQTMRAGICSVEELSEYFDVTEEFMQYRLELFKTMGGVQNEQWCQAD